MPAERVSSKNGFSTYREAYGDARKHLIAALGIHKVLAKDGKGRKELIRSFRRNITETQEQQRKASVNGKGRKALVRSFGPDVSSILNRHRKAFINHLEKHADMDLRVDQGIVPLYLTLAANRARKQDWSRPGHVQELNALVNKHLGTNRSRGWEKRPASIMTYRDVVENTHNLLAEANRVHAIRKSRDAKAIWDVTVKYEQNVLRQRERNGKESDEPISISEVLEMLGAQYQDRLFMHLANNNLKSEGIFNKDVIRSLIENSTIRKWSNRMQFQEMKGLVEELLDKEEKKKED